MTRSTSTRLRTRVAIAALSLSLAAATGSAAAAQVTQSAPGATDPAAIRMNYVVNTGTGASAITAAEKAVKSEGGTVLVSYKEVGIVVAQSSKSGFATALRGSKYKDVVDSVGATRTVEAPPPKIEDEYGPLAPALAIKADPMEKDQWGNTALDSLAANKIQPGDPKVLVGDLDSGIDDTHPDLTANFDKADSVSCVTGVADTTAGAWRPTASTHGTHTAGTIAAARDGQGVAGIAPSVSIASIKVGDDAGFIYPEYAICGFMWAAAHGVDVTNNSYFIDPWFFWCKNDPDQSAVQTAMKRVLTYTASKNIVTVVAAGNSGYDLGKQTSDSSSPDDSDPITRPLNKNCLQLPGQIKSVVTVSATTEAGPKASFSNFGVGQIEVAAPGNAILSTTWPGHGWGYLSGTSMAAPHVTGVVALIQSQHPGMKAADVIKLLEKSAVNTPCPDGVQACEGTLKYNGYFGYGLVNALAAVK